MKLHTPKGVEEIFKNAQKAYNAWCKKEAQDKTTDSLLRSLDFFELLDSVTIARSRKHIERYYDIGVLGSFPKRSRRNPCARASPPRKTR